MLSARWSYSIKKRAEPRANYSRNLSNWRVPVRHIHEQPGFIEVAEQVDED
jgi:hypothetical protein